MNRKAVVVVLFSVIFGARGLFAQQVVTWHLALLKEGKGLPFENNTPVNLNNGDKFRIELYADKDCYAYILVEQASGAMHAFESRYLKAEEKMTTDEIDLSSHGQEKFFVVVSYAKQEALQRAIDAYNNDRNPENNTNLLTRLSEIRDRERPGKPTAFGGIAGSIRDPDAPLATEYSGSAAYKKIIIISH